MMEKINIPNAKEALATYYKGRTYPAWYYDPLHPNKSSVIVDIHDSDSIVRVRLLINY